MNILGHPMSPILEPEVKILIKSLRAIIFLHFMFFCIQV